MSGVVSGIINGISQETWESFLENAEKTISSDQKFCKETCSLDNDQLLQIIKSVTNPSKPKELIWITNRATFSKAAPHGMIPPSSLLGQVIYFLGKYRLATLKRAAFANVKDKHIGIKNQLLGYVFEALEILKPVERLTNTYDPMKTPDENRQCFMDVLLAAQEQVSKLIEEITRLPLPLGEKDADCFKKFFRHLALLQEAMGEKYLEAENCSEKLEVQALFSSMGMSSIGYFLRKQIAGILSITQELNQNLTTLRGDLHSYIEEALFALNHHKPDWHNRILPEHQGDYVLEGNGAELVLIRASDYGITDSAGLVDFALSAAFLSHSGNLIMDASKLNSSQAAKWQTYGHGPWRPASPGLINTIAKSIKNLTLAPFNFLKGLALGEVEPVLATGICESSSAQNNIDLFNMLENLSIDSMPLGLGAGMALHRVFKNIAESSWSGIKEGLREFLGQIADGFTTDYRHGYKKRDLEFRKELSDITKVFASAQAKKEELLDQKHRADIAVFSAQIPVLEDDFEEAPLSPVKILHASKLASYHPDGLLPALAEGGRSFYDLFDRNLFAKHSFISFVFLVTYGAGALAVMAPELLKSYIGSGSSAETFVSLSQTIGNAFANGAFSSAIAAGFTEAKIASGLLELLLHGTDSWIFKAGRNIRRNLSEYLIYTLGAVGFGWLIAEKASVPWLSQHLHDDAGTVPFLAYGFAGLKIALILAHALTAKDHHEKLDLKPEMFSIHAKKIIESGKKSPLTADERYALKNILPQEFDCAEVSDNRHRIGESSAQPIARIKEAEPYLKRLGILKRLVAYQTILPTALLTRQDKRDIAELVRGNFDKETAEYLCQIIYPVKQRSLIGQTIHMALVYPGAIFRLMLSPLSGSGRPWEDLKVKLERDLSSNLTAILDIGSIFMNILDRLVRTPMDLLVNEVIARIEYGFFASHHVSSFAYGISQHCHGFKEKLGQCFYALIYALQKRQTRPELQAVIKEGWAENTHQALSCSPLYKFIVHDLKERLPRVAPISQPVI